MRTTIAAFFVFGLSLTTVSQAAAGRRPYVACPRFLVQSQDGTFQKFSDLLPGVRCSNDKRALNRLGLIQTNNSQPVVIQNPELDTERVFRGVGKIKITRAFRVTTVARVVTLTNDCEGGLLIASSITGSKGDEAFRNSITIFEPGIYGIDITYVGSDACGLEVVVK